MVHTRCLLAGSEAVTPQQGAPPSALEQCNQSGRTASRSRESPAFAMLSGGGPKIQCKSKHAMQATSKTIDAQRPPTSSGGQASARGRPRPQTARRAAPKPQRAPTPPAGRVLPVCQSVQPGNGVNDDSVPLHQRLLGLDGLADRQHVPGVHVGLLGQPQQKVHV